MCGGALSQNKADFPAHLFPVPDSVLIRWNKVSQSENKVFQFDPEMMRGGLGFSGHFNDVFPLRMKVERLCEISSMDQCEDKEAGVPPCLCGDRKNQTQAQR